MDEDLRGGRPGWNVFWKIQLQLSGGRGSEDGGQLALSMGVTPNLNPFRPSCPLCLCGEIPVEQVGVCRQIRLNVAL